MLADEGDVGVEATTAGQAYEFLNRHSSLQLVVTDVQTPGELDGFVLARVVAERWPHICVVIASGAACCRRRTPKRHLHFQAVDPGVSPSAPSKTLRPYQFRQDAITRAPQR
ncbi:hypothetical protein LJR098_002344 [Rhizobium sp. LjRoot98]|uniref:hypothetical protein n=1 Tax=Rhizobium sp. LjRoot98 TaxID=3342345 RepID=UPI003ECD96AB